ncbi:hypothetical protein Barb4_05260 [Bacteroidales bacterium Barb4]|nr:hypothetical protein Barb4_05260 [Bacteroidales bacterium Barb4]
MEGRGISSRRITLIGPASALFHDDARLNSQERRYGGNVHRPIGLVEVS